MSFLIYAEASDFREIWGEKEKSPALTYKKKVKIKGICGKTIGVPWEIVSLIDVWIMLKSAIIFHHLKSYIITYNI